VEKKSKKEKSELGRILGARHDWPSFLGEDSGTSAISCWILHNSDTPILEVPGRRERRDDGKAHPDVVIVC
jgi:hypothetical protein